MQAPVRNYPGTSVEWVTENQHHLETISRKRDVFPSPPGVYTVNVLSVPDEPSNAPGEFMVEPVLSVVGEPLIQFTGSHDYHASLAREGVYPGSVRLWLDGRRALVEGTDFNVDHSTGGITFLSETPSGSYVTADYKYLVAPTGPYRYQREEFSVDAIPGAVIAFGDRVQKDDRVSVVVFDGRKEAADVYGGKFEVSFDLLVFTKDSDDRERMADYVTVKLLELQNRIGFEGLEIVDVSPGAESEEVFNDTSDEYYYDRTVSMTVRVDWEVYFPLPLEIQRHEFTSRSTEVDTGYLGSYPLDLLRAVDPERFASIPVIVGKKLTYESIF